MPNLSALNAFLADHKVAMAWIAAVSSVLFVGCLLIAPWLAIQIPTDYFAGRRRPRTLFADRHPVLRWTGLVVKNMIGGVLVLAGLLMLVLPGQGLLTILVGILMLNFPGKHRLERRLVSIPAVLNSINWMRKRSGVEPIQVRSLGGP
ncbi:PGPGW domain-containing protein [Rhodopirellula sp. JC639]|uniref:PGPGW domain-containing protein n=1 Tax=Stieleria mannarensis TaxID=2755585 RepID=UPI00160377E3|nr:PGPGW domain-containing protein [Rhodopirellula sp. JC639]